LLNRFRMPTRVLLGAGFITVAIANLLTGGVLTTDSGFATFVFPLALGGVGFGLIFVPLSVTMLSSVQGIDTQKATSLQSLCQQLGGSISTAMLVTLLDRRSAFHQDAIAAHETLHASGVQQMLQHHGSLAALAQLVAQQATTMAFADAFYFLGIVTLILTPLVLLLRPRAAAPSGGAPAAAAAE